MPETCRSFTTEVCHPMMVYTRHTRGTSAGERGATYLVPVNSDLDINPTSNSPRHSHHTRDRADPHRSQTPPATHSTRPARWCSTPRPQAAPFARCLCSKIRTAGSNIFADHDRDKDERDERGTNPAKEMIYSKITHAYTRWPPLQRWDHKIVPLA